MNLQKLISSTSVASLISAYLLTSSAMAGPRTFDNSTWIDLASQTCVRQAPQNEAVSALKLTSSQLRYSCRCVAMDMIDILPTAERARLIEQMQARRNLQQTGESMMRNPRVKAAIASCSAASYIWS